VRSKLTSDEQLTLAVIMLVDCAPAKALVDFLREAYRHAPTGQNGILA
jgi:hypothetical protein